MIYNRAEQQSRVANGMQQCLYPTSGSIEEQSISYLGDDLKTMATSVPPLPRLCISLEKEKR